jgi:ABC-2 type transport system permease protein
VSALFRRELSRLARSQTAIASALFFVLGTSIPSLASGTALSASIPAFARFAGIIPYVLCVVLPAFTMGLWSDEEKAGTYKLLLAFPVDELEIVVAKFGAAALFSVFLLALTLPVAILSPAGASAPRFANSGALTVASSYIALTLFAAASTAIGTFWSFATRRAIPAFLLTVTSILALSIYASNGFLRKAFRGSIETADAFFFISLIFVFLLLSDQSLARRRKLP